MEIQCVAPCEACFNTEEYTPAKEERFATLSNETTSKILGVG
jgi:hypothetical protein